MTAPTTTRLSRPDTKAGRFQRAALDLLNGPKHRLAQPEPALPSNLRFLFYELEHEGIVTKDKSRDRRNDSTYLSEATMVLRRLGLIPWSWIVDETRSLDEWSFAASAYEYVLDRVDEIRIDLWAGVPPPLVITESRSLSGVLRGLAARYLCPITSTNGQAGGFVHTDLIPSLGADPGRCVLCLGDWDLAGGHIEANTRNEIEAEIGPLTWERVAITPEQIATHHLEPIEKLDRRYRPARYYQAWETEGLGQTFVIGLLRARLDELLPEPIERVLVREAEQRDDIRRRLDAER